MEEVFRSRVPVQLTLKAAMMSDSTYPASYTRNACLSFKSPCRFRDVYSILHEDSVADADIPNIMHGLQDVINEACSLSKALSNRPTPGATNSSNSEVHYINIVLGRNSALPTVQYLGSIPVAEQSDDLCLEFCLAYLDRQLKQDINRNSCLDPSLYSVLIH